MDSVPQPVEVDFFFEPSCPWTWVTSRWLVAASEHRQLRITWRPYSLAIKQGDDVDDDEREDFEAGLRALRVVADLSRRVGNDAAGTFYAERGYRFFGTRETPDIAHVLEASGLDPGHAVAADDESLDEDIRASMDEAHRLAGPDNGSPIISVRESGRGFFGPVLTALPSPRSCGLLWDHLVEVSSISEFQELKRDRPSGPTAPPRP